MNIVRAVLTALLLSISIFVMSGWAGNIQEVDDQNEFYMLGEGRRYMINEPLPVHRSRC